jgi:hypothetical protein
VAADLSYLTAPDCHLCARGRGIVDALARDLGLSVEEIPWADERAATLVARDGVSFPPALYRGDRLLGFGRLSARRLHKLLEGVPA